MSSEEDSAGAEVFSEEEAGASVDSVGLEVLSPLLSEVLTELSLPLLLLLLLSQEASIADAETTTAAIRIAMSFFI